MAQAIPPHGTDHTDERVRRIANGIAAALAPARRMEFYRELVANLAALAAAVAELREAQ